MTAHRAPPQRDAVPAQSLFALLAYALLFVLALLALRTALPTETPLHTDSVRDSALARNCAGSPCYLAGAPTNVEGLRQGGFWVVHLALLDALGCDLDDAAGVGLVLLAAALTLLAGVTEWVTRSRSLAFLAVTGLIWYHVAEPTYWRIQWNPSLLLAPCVVLTGLLAAAARTRQPRYFLAASFVLALAIQVHPVAAVYAAGLAALLALRPPLHRPWRVALLAVATTVVSLLALSWNALLASLGSLFATGTGHAQPGAGPSDLSAGSGLLAAAALFVLLVGGPWAWRRVTGRKTTPSPGYALTAALAVPTVALLVPVLLAAGGPVQRYLVPTLPALCLLAVSLLVAPARLLLRPPSPGSLRTRLGRYVGWTMPLAVSLLCLPLILGGRPLNVVGRQLLSATNPVGCHWNVADAAALSHRLSERGIEGARHAASVLRLPSPEAFFLHFVQTGSDTSVPPRAACGEALAALPSTVPPDELPREWLLRSRWDGTHLYLVPLPAALDWTDTRVGFFEASPPAEELPLQQARIGHVRPLQLSWIAAPTLHADGPIRSVVVRVPVRLPDSGGIRVRALPLCKVPEHTVHVRSAEGLLLDSLRDDEGLLLPGDGGRLSGTVTLEWRMVPGMGEFPRHLLAPLALELPTESNPLDRLLEGFRCP